MKKNLVVFLCASIILFLKLWSITFVAPFLLSLPYGLALPVITFYLGISFFIVLLCVGVIMSPESFRTQVLEWH